MICENKAAVAIFATVVFALLLINIEAIPSPRIRSMRVGTFSLNIFYAKPTNIVYIARFFHLPNTS